MLLLPLLLTLALGCRVTSQVEHRREDGRDHLARFLHRVLILVEVECQATAAVVHLQTSGQERNAALVKLALEKQ